MNPTLLLVLSTACPASSPAPDAPGLVAVGKVPAMEAMKLNGDGKQLYRQQRWSEAQEKYRAALAADPDLLGAELNVACSLSRQGRYDEAADEAASLIRKAYVPWSREVEEAADLGILQDHPAAYAKVAVARKQAAEAWGKQTRAGVFVVARTRPPVKVSGEGVLVLGLNQEIFAWVPETGRFFQMTSEDGRVLAFAVSPDGRRIAYLVAGKLVRHAGQAGTLRGLGLRVLDLQGMVLGPSLSLSGDAGKVELWFGTEPELRVTEASGAVSRWRLGERGLEPSPRSPAPSAESVVLTGAGVAPTSRPIKQGKCRFTLSPQHDRAGLWRVQVSRPGVKPFTLDTRYGAGLGGMLFAVDSPAGAPSEPTGAHAGERGLGRKAGSKAGRKE